MLFPDAISELRDSYDSESQGKSPQSENPDTTWQTLPPVLESKSLLEQNCCRLAHPIKSRLADPVSQALQFAFTEVFS